MARYCHTSRGQVFEIDVLSVTLIHDEIAPFFVAYVSLFDHGVLVPVCNSCGRREVYGPTEMWAFQNACHLVDAGVWRAHTDRASKQP